MSEQYLAEILVIEDSASSFELLRQLLTKANYSVRHAPDGLMGLKTINAKVPDLIIADIQMPNMNGFEFCEEMKRYAHTKNIPVIFCSALNDSEYRVEGFRRGAVDYIPKPYHPDEVLHRVNTHVELANLRNSLTKLIEEKTEQLEQKTFELQKEIIHRKKVESERILTSKAFETSFSGMLICNHRGKIVSVNPAFSEMTGFTSEKILHQSINILRIRNSSDTTHINVFNGLEQSGNWSGELLIRCANANELPMMTNIKMVEHESGELHYIVSMLDLSASKDAQTLIDFLAYRDNLTGLSNKVMAKTFCENALLKAEHKGGCVALIYIDIDRFSLVNESLGHDIGDHILKIQATRIERFMEKFYAEHEYLISRVGGDEFVIICACESGEESVDDFVTKLQHALRQKIQVHKHRFLLTCSAGIALGPFHGNSFNELYKNAENALNHIKRNQGNGYSIFHDEMSEEVSMRLEIEHELRNAVSNNEFTLLYQPKLSLKTGRIVGAESLLRWHSPKLGFVPPNKFIPLAEQSDLILKIDEWVLNETARQLKLWMDKTVEPVRVSVNISSTQFHSADLVGLVEGIVTTHDIPFSLLELEITEGVLMEDINNALPLLNQLRAMDVNVALDDFGTGYSSFSYLQKLPITTLKVDKLFVDNLHHHKSDAVITKTIIDLGKSLSLNVIAEGVEHQAQLDFLRENGCDEIQGYFFSRPISPMEFESMLRAQSNIEEDKIQRLM